MFIYHGLVSLSQVTQSVLYVAVAMMIRRIVTNPHQRRQFFFSWRNNNTDEIPQPRGLPLIGTTLTLIAQGSAPKLHIYIDKRHKQYGPIFRDKIGPISAVFIADPEQMRHVFANEGKHPRHVLPEAWTVYNRKYGRKRGLFFMDGDEWLHYRKIMNRLLLRGDLGMIETACKKVSEDLVERIRLVGPCVDDLEKELYRWSLNVITAVLLGGDGYVEKKRDLEGVLANLATTVSSVFEASVDLQLLPAVLAEKLNLPPWRRFVRCVGDALDISTALVTQLLAERLSNHGLLARMLQENLQPPEIVKLVADLILAAGDTTAYTMEWLLYLIAKNPNRQQQLRNTLQPVDLKNCIRETLRLYPVAPFITRYLPNETKIAGYQIRKNTLIIMSLYTIGRDGKYFENPDAFQPERWLRTDKTTTAAAAMGAAASLPFAIGARSCIGRRIAEMQLQLALAYLVRNFDIKLLMDGARDVEMVLKMIAVPKEPVRLQFNQIVPINL